MCVCVCVCVYLLYRILVAIEKGAFVFTIGYGRPTYIHTYISMYI